MLWQSLVFLSVVIQKHPNNALTKERANVWSTCLLCGAPHPRHGHPSQWAGRRPIIPPFMTGICNEIKVFFDKRPYFLNVLYNTSLIFSYAWNLPWIKTHEGLKYISVSPNSETLKCPVFYRCHFAFPFLAAFLLVLILKYLHRP